MHEDIFPALTCDKTEAFSGVEPLNCSLFHLYLFPDVNLTLEISNVSAGAEEKQLAELEFLTQLYSNTPADLHAGFRQTSAHTIGNGQRLVEHKFQQGLAGHVDLVSLAHDLHGCSGSCAYACADRRALAASGDRSDEGANRGSAADFLGRTCSTRTALDFIIAGGESERP